MMITKGNKLYSILFNKCPKCHEGDFMVEKNLLKIHRAYKMYNTCSNCGLKYLMEPSFYYGAMYVNYGLTVAFSIATFAIATLFFNLTFLESFIPIVLVLIATMPISIRLSRIIWINIFVSFNPPGSKNQTDE